jgi:ABC-type branched-subunit amino acid transport system substrate-binding protein
MKHARWIAAICVLMALAAPAAGASVANAPALANAPAPERTLRIGVIAPFTGSHAWVGQMLRRGMDLAVDAANASGGVRGHHVAFIYADSTGSARGALEAAAALLNHYGVSALAGGHTTPECRSIAAFALNRGMPYVMTGGDDPALIDPRSYTPSAMRAGVVRSLLAEDADAMDSGPLRAQLSALEDKSAREADALAARFTVYRIGRSMEAEARSLASMAEGATATMLYEDTPTGALWAGALGAAVPSLASAAFPFDPYGPPSGLTAVTEATLERETAVMYLAAGPEGSRRVVAAFGPSLPPRVVGVGEEFTLGVLAALSPRVAHASGAEFLSLDVAAPVDARPDAREFFNAFRERYGVRPDRYAYAAYEAAVALLHAAEGAASFRPADVGVAYAADSGARLLFEALPLEPVRWREGRVESVLAPALIPPALIQ